MKEPQNIKNLVVEPFKEKMYFMSREIVSRANFDGSEKEMIHGSGVRAFALDSVERRMYWVEDNDGIYKGNMNFSERKFIGFFAYKDNIAVDSYSRLATHFLKPHTLL